MWYGVSRHCKYEITDLQVSFNQGKYTLRKSALQLVIQNIANLNYLPLLFANIYNEIIYIIL